MKKISIYHLLTVLSVVLLTSCNQTDNMYFDNAYTGIYFQEDSMHYSFSVTPLDVNTYTLNVPVRIMGATSKESRTFKAEAITNKSTATSGKQYTLLTDKFVVLGDSINGVLPVQFMRTELGDSVWRLELRLTENETFEPTNEKKFEISITFDNLVTPPAWKSWNGKPYWPSYALGPWNSNVWIKFMEIFRTMEQSAPVTYKNIIESCGPNLEKDWPSDYGTTIKKYVLIPLYDFFEAHPEYGAEVPNPRS